MISRPLNSNLVKMGIAIVSLSFLCSEALAADNVKEKPMLADKCKDPSIYKTDSFLQKLMPSVKFWVNFEESPEPVMGAPNTSQGAKRYEDAPGIVGKAFLTKNGSFCHYTGEGNLDFSKPGALSFWISPVAWVESDAQPLDVFFMTIPNLKHEYLGIQRQGILREQGVITRARNMMLWALDFPDISANTVALMGGRETWSKGEC